MRKIAIVGTGVIGVGMASNFIKKGYQVYIYNRTPEKLNSILLRGCYVVSSPKEATEMADIIFETTANDESSRTVWLGDNGIISGANKEKILITSATLSDSWVQELSSMCEEKKLNFLDIPVTGGRSGAESGNLALLVGGGEAKLEEIRSDLSVVGSHIYYFGKAGNGTKFKLILNMVQATHIAIFSDAMKIAKRIGLDDKSVGEALSDRMGGTTSMAWRDYEKNINPVNFSVELMSKDLHYAKLLVGNNEIPILEDILKIFDKLIKDGYGKEDWTIITKI